MNKYIKYFLIILFIAFTVFVHYKAKKPNISEGKMEFNNASLENMQGQNVSLDDYKGKRPLILYFWNTYVPVCGEEMALLSKFYNENSPQSELFFINAGDLRLEIENFLKKKDLNNINVLLDSTGLVTRNFKVSEPTMLILDKSGNEIFRYSYSKSRKSFKEVLEKEVTPLLEK